MRGAVPGMGSASALHDSSRDRFIAFAKRDAVVRMSRTQCRVPPPHLE